VKNIILGVTGSIAAYRAAELANVLTRDGYSVHVIMSAGAQKFITPLSFQTLTRNKVYTDMFDESFYEDVRHISLAHKAELAVIAPASANCIGKIAAGIADDMLCTVIMALGGKPVLLCPAMNTAMYENPIVQENIKKLSALNYKFVGPRESRLACGDLGKGALADIQDIVAAVKGLV